MADRRALALVVAGAAAAVALCWLGTSREGKERTAAQLYAAASAGAQGSPAGASGSMSIRTGITPPVWTPYCPPGAHTGAHRMYRHPKNSSPNFSRMTTAGNAYDWVFAPPSEVDL